MLPSVKRPVLLCFVFAVLVLSASGALRAQSRPRLIEWERGVALQAPGAGGMVMYLWFYEWNMFEAVSPGQHTQGTFKLPRRVDPGGAEAVLGPPSLCLRVRAVPGGADLSLEVTNETNYDWPELAGVIPCWSPGRLVDAKASNPPAFYHVPANRQFADSEHTRTFFLTRDGLAPLASRDIHFNGRLRDRLNRASANGQFVFSNKWPTSNTDAAAGLLIRESADGKWVTGVGWEDYLSVQGHNPWNCMHACVRVGPLKKGERKTVRGRVYLFPGDRAACLARFQKDFPPPR